MKKGVILYGPPAAGKDTVTQALTELDSRYAQFARLKVGTGKSSGYRMSTVDQLRGLEATGDAIYANSRYGNTYVIDRPGLSSAFQAGIPVVHLGQVDGIRALLGGYPAAWVVVGLWCPREVTAQRSSARGDRDTAARLTAWDATREDVDANPDLVWDRMVNTAATTPEESARLIDQLVVRRGRAGAV
ncbi:guanylate kinase [Streptomyces sp. NPDC004589]|uniref:phosphotransferase-like protein n=1 Tax=Streptomyces sp. NPDC004589 TaxID=3154553 RepID=UPI0033B31646